MPNVLAEALTKAPSGSHLVIKKGFGTHIVDMKPLGNHSRLVDKKRREIHVHHGMKVILQIVMKD